MKKIGTIIILGGMITLPLVLLIIPSSFFDHGQSMCLSVLLFNQKCLGCGITRGIQHLIHLDFSIAYSYNKLSFIVLPILIFLWIREFLRRFKKLKEDPKS